MKITAARQPESQVLLEIEVEPERVKASLDQAYKRIVGRYRIPGFRPGKAPRVMFERYVGRETLLREALGDLVPKVYEEAVKEEALDPIDEPQFEIPTTEPLLIKATVPVRPSVDLGDYRAIRVEREPFQLDHSRVDEALEELRRRYGTVTPVDRPVQAGDRLRLHLDMRIDDDDKNVMPEDETELQVTEDGLRYLPGLFERLPGLEKSVEYSFAVDVPDEDKYEELRGKAVRYRLTIDEIKEDRLPALDDDFAREVDAGYDSLLALRAKVAGDVETRAKEQADRDYEQKVLEAIRTAAQVSYPAVLVERETHQFFHEQFQSTGLGGSDAQLHNLMNNPQLRAAVRPAAEARVMRALLLTQLAEQEGLTVDASEIDTEIERVASASSAQSQRMRELFSTEQGRSMLERQLLITKVYERLRDLGEGRELPPQARASTPLPPVAAVEPIPLGETDASSDAEATLDRAGDDSRPTLAAEFSEPEGVEDTPTTGELALDPAALESDEVSTEPTVP